MNTLLEITGRVIPLTPFEGGTRDCEPGRWLAVVS